MAWHPESGFGVADWNGYDESMILYVLALGSPTHPATDGAWEAFCSTYRWAEHEGQTYLNFAPLFGHQFSHAWIDFRGIQDAFMRAEGNRLLRELPPRAPRAAGLRDREPGGLPRVLGETSGASRPATGRPT